MKKLLGQVTIIIGIKTKIKKRVNYAVKETLDLEIHVQIHSSVGLLQIYLFIDLVQNYFW